MSGCPPFGWKCTYCFQGIYETRYLSYKFSFNVKNYQHQQKLIVVSKKYVVHLRFRPFRIHFERFFFKKHFWKKYKAWVFQANETKTYRPWVSLVVPVLFLPTNFFLSLFGTFGLLLFFAGGASSSDSSTTKYLYMFEKHTVLVLDEYDENRKSKGNDIYVQ